MKITALKLNSYKLIGLIYILSISLTNNLTAQCNNWLNISGSQSGSGVGSFNGMAMDDNGNTYTTIWVDSSTAIINGAVIQNTPSVQYSQMLVISKLDSSGILLWNKKIEMQFGTTPVALHFSSNNLYLSFTTIGGVFADGQNYTNIDRNIFVFKINPNGQTNWLKTYSRIYNSQNLSLGWTTGITSDKMKNVILTGHFNGEMIIGNDTIRTNSLVSSSREGFIIKLDSNGNELWTTQTNPIPDSLARYNRGWSIVTDKNDDIVITGLFTRTFSLGGISIIDSNFSYKPFVAKLDKNNGNALWIKSGHYPPGPQSYFFSHYYGIAVDIDNNILVSGSIDSALVFDNTILNPTGQRPISLLKLDSTGNILFSKNFGSKPIGTGYDIAVDKNNNIYLQGFAFQGAVFDSFTIGGTSSSKISYTAAINNNGQVLDLYYLEGSDDVSAFKIQIDKDFKIYTSGSFIGDTLRDNNSNLTLPNINKGAFINKVCFNSFNPVSITEINPKNNNFKIVTTPNPTSGNLTIEINSDKKETVIVNFYDNLGRHIKFEKVQIKIGANNLYYDFTHLRKGLYHIKFSTNNFGESVKFMKN